MKAAPSVVKIRFTDATEHLGQAHPNPEKRMAVIQGIDIGRWGHLSHGLNKIPCTRFFKTAKVKDQGSLQPSSLSKVSGKRAEVPKVTYAVAES